MNSNLPTGWRQKAHTEAWTPNMCRLRKQIEDYNKLLRKSYIRNSNFRSKIYHILSRII